jgi:hypothetical protein
MVLAAKPTGVSSKECRRLAKPILTDTQGYPTKLESILSAATLKVQCPENEPLGWATRGEPNLTFCTVRKASYPVGGKFPWQGKDTQGYP